MNMHYTNYDGMYAVGYAAYSTNDRCLYHGHAKLLWEKGWNGACQDKNEAVIWLNDTIIDYGYLSLVEKFFTHLVRASKEPLNFVFEHGNHKMNAQEWLDFHAVRLKMPMRGLLILRTKNGSQSHVIIPEDVCYYV
jgi:hypothetical protein